MSTKRISVKELKKRKYGRLIILDEISPHYYPSGVTRRRFKCICDCGNIVIVLISRLRSGHTQSCGCLNIDKIIERNTKHGFGNHVLCHTFLDMIRRCYNRDYVGYKYWGGRGIIICKEWLNNPILFYEWALNNGWQEKLQIDRIDNDGNYEPNNCRFTTAKENIRNNSHTKLSYENVKIIKQLYSNKLYLQKELAVMFSVAPNTISQVINGIGWQ